MNGLDIKKIREFIGLTQAELAQKLGVKTNTIYCWESGRRNLRNKCTIDAIKNLKKSKEMRR